MGRFDNIKCKYPLPGNPAERIQTAEFQTKSLWDGLDWYEITEDGRLLLTEKQEDSEASPEEVERYTGSIIFYDSLFPEYERVLARYARKGLSIMDESTEERNSYDFQYEATFENGRLINIIRNLADWPEPEHIPRRERERRAAEVHEQGITYIDEVGSIPIRGLQAFHTSVSFSPNRRLFVQTQETPRMSEQRNDDRRERIGGPTNNPSATIYHYAGNAYNRPLGRGIVLKDGIEGAHDLDLEDVLWHDGETAIEVFAWKKGEALSILQLIEDLTDADPCDYDQNNECQTHSTHVRPCPHEQAQNLLATLRTQATTPPSTDEQGAF